MAYSCNIEVVNTDDVPCVEDDIRRAKKFLQKHSPESGDSLYDHLSQVLTKILAEKPKNAVDLFEEYSRKVKEERFKSQSGYLRDVYVPPAQYEDAKKLIKLFESRKADESLEEDRLVGVEKEEEEEEEDKTKQMPNMLDLLFYFEQANVGLPRSEMVLLNLAMRKLAADSAMRNIRFWGKILGSPKNYYVIEADLREEELTRRLEKVEKPEEEKEKTDVNTNADGNVSATKELEIPITSVKDERGGEAEIQEKEGSPLQLIFPPLPTVSFSTPPEVPAEKIGTGVNQKVYFVCNSPGLDEWIELPPVTPQQIIIARQIVRYCTGSLDTPIYTLPPFPGTERNYVRAQIARISATTQISPIGFFTLGEEGEEEEDEDDEGKVEDGVLSENADYDPLPIRDLVDPSMSNWCHHAQYILKQGRTVWWNPEKTETEEDLDEEEEEDEGEEEEDSERRGSEFEKEVGPLLLTPLSEDAIQDSITPWTALQSSFIEPDLAIAIVRSNIWPGAFAFATGKRFANVYIGWGHKYTAYNYSPPSMPNVQDQYPIGPEIMEIPDPTAEAEEAYRIAHLPPEIAASVDGEEMEEADEEDEEDDEDDL